MESQHLYFPRWKKKSVLYLPRKLNWYWFIWFCAQKAQARGKTCDLCRSTFLIFSPISSKKRKVQKSQMRLAKDLQFHFSDLGTKWSSISPGSVPFKGSQIWGSSRTTWAILFTYHMHFFSLFSPPPPSHRWVLEAEPTLGYKARHRQLWRVLLLSTRHVVPMWAGGSDGFVSAWAQLTTAKVSLGVGGMPWICADYGTGFVFPASRCFFVLLNCSGGESRGAGAHGKCMARMSAIASQLHFAKGWSLWTMHTHSHDKSLRLQAGEMACVLYQMAPFHHSMLWTGALDTN